MPCYLSPTLTGCVCVCVRAAQLWLALDDTLRSMGRERPFAHVTSDDSQTQSQLDERERVTARDQASRLLASRALALRVGSLCRPFFLVPLLRPRVEIGAHRRHVRCVSRERRLHFYLTRGLLRLLQQPVCAPPRRAGPRGAPHERAHRALHAGHADSHRWVPSALLAQAQRATVSACMHTCRRRRQQEDRHAGMDRVHGQVRSD
jgi:hypothetical protein